MTATLTQPDELYGRTPPTKRLPAGQWEWHAKKDRYVNKATKQEATALEHAESFSWRLPEDEWIGSEPCFTSVPPERSLSDYDVLRRARKKWRPGPKWNAFVAALPRAEAYQDGDYMKAALEVVNA